MYATDISLWLQPPLLLAAGGYDETMRTNGEDAEMSRRLRGQG